MTIKEHLEGILRRGDATAVADAAGDLSYGGLLVAAQQRAKIIQDLELSANPVVGVCSHRCADFYAWVYGCWLAGAAYLALDPVNPDERLAKMVRVAKPSVIVSNDENASRIGQIARADDIKLQTLAVPSDNGSLSDPTTPIQVADGDVAYILFTSGSTGDPKGVRVTHGNVQYLLEAQQRLNLVPLGSSVVATAPVGFDASIWEILLALGSGTTLKVLPTRLDEWEGSRRLGVATLVPSVLETLDPAEWHFDGVISAGERLSSAQVARWAGVTTIRNAYGPTEATVCATISAPLSIDQTEPGIGEPLPGCAVYLRSADGETFRSSRQAEGELIIAGNGVAAGYVGFQAAKTSPFSCIPIDGVETPIYATGDIVRRGASGELFYVGRADQQVKLLGRRVELGEIETALITTDGVDAVRVIADVAPNGTPTLHALWRGGLVTADDLRSSAEAHLPAYMVPASFTRVAAFPSTPAGKADLLALKQLIAATDQPSASFPKELAWMAEIWSSVLDAPVESASSSFFELGGHSLLAMRLVARVSSEVGTRIPVRVIFDQPVLQAFTNAVETFRVDALTDIK